MYRFDLSGVELAQKSGISMSQISRFRGGKNVRVETIEQLLAAMPQDARNYMLSLVAQTGTEAESLPPKSEAEEDPNG